MEPRYAPIVRVITAASPAAGAEFTITPDRASWWLIMSLRFQFVASAVAASRGISVGATDGNNQYIRLRATATQTAGQTLVYCGFPGASGGASGGAVSAMDWPTTGLWIPQGGSLSSVCANIDVGDQYSAIAAMIMEFPKGPTFAMQPMQPWHVQDMG